MNSGTLGKESNMLEQSNHLKQVPQRALTVEELRQRLIDQLRVEQKIIEELTDEELNVVTSDVSLGESGHISEELSEPDMQAVHGGVKVGNPREMLNDVLRNPRTPSSVSSASSSSLSSSSSFGIGRMETGHDAPPQSHSGVPKAWLASASGLAAGGTASFAVGAVASKLSISG
jgi:hypothetical protein